MAQFFCTELQYIQASPRKGAHDGRYAPSIFPSQAKSEWILRLHLS